MTKLIKKFVGMATVRAMSEAFAVAGRVSDLGFSIAIANANKDLNYFVKLVEDMGSRAQIAEETSSNLHAAFDDGMGDDNVPEVFDNLVNLDK